MFNRMRALLAVSVVVLVATMASTGQAKDYAVTALPQTNGLPANPAYINDAGDIAGMGYIGNSSLPQAFLYSDGIERALNLPGAAYGNCIGLNPQGWVLGESFFGSPASPGGFAGYFLYADGVTENLGTTYPSGLILSDGFNENNLGTVDLTTSDLQAILPGWTALTPNGCIANSEGQIAGVGMSPQGFTIFLLTPVPEPSTLALLAAGAVGLIGCLWRRRRITQSFLAKSAAVAVVLLSVSTFASGADMTYNLVDYPADETGTWAGQCSLSGSIVTDGMVGTLSYTDVVSWSYTITNSGGYSGACQGVSAYNPSDPDPGYINGWGGITATPTQLILGTNGILWLREDGPLGGTLDYNYEWPEPSGGMSGGSIYQGTSTPSDWPPSGDPAHALFGWQSVDPPMFDGTPLVIAQTAPEPSTIALLSAGAIGLVGYAWRRRRKRPLSLAGERTLAGPGETGLQDDVPAVLSFPANCREAARRAA